MSNINDPNDIGNTQQKDDWQDYFQRGKNGQVISNLRNCSLVVENDPKFLNVHWFNDMTRSEVLRNERGVYYLIDDIYFMHVQQYMQNHHPLRTIGIENVRNSILLNCHEHKFHPVRDELNALKWDNEQRIDTWTIKYLGAADTPYNRKIGRFFIISMMARVYCPGCKCDHMMVLEGDQGIGKSTVCKILFGEYFSDYLPDISTKDACDHVTKFWGIEIAEMHIFNRSETAALKSFISRTTEQYRPPYGHMEIARQRQCVFMGTTNQELYLKDETGGRRFWPVRCGHIDIDGLKDDRNQLLAEALHCYRKGWAWWPDRDFEANFIKPEQAARQEFDEWQHSIVRNLSAIQDCRRATIEELYRVCLGISDGRCSNSDQQRIAKILKRLGAKQLHTRTGRFWNLSAVTGV